jgi:hypothetical protein
MQSTFQSISDILQLLHSDAQSSSSQDTIDNCSNILLNMNNILKYEISSKDTITCSLSMQDNLINNIYKIQQVLYDADTFVNATLATNELQNLINEVHLVCNNRWKQVQMMHY